MLVQCINYLEHFSPKYKCHVIHHIYFH
jgi:hypothetical protein